MEKDPDIQELRKVIVERAGYELDANKAHLVEKARLIGVPVPGVTVHTVADEQSNCSVGNVVDLARYRQK
jgi:hypothetical protein